MLLETWCAAAPLAEEEDANDSTDTTSDHTGGAKIL